MSVGLDLGSHSFRSLRRKGNQLMARSTRAVYAIILDNPARRALFAEQQVPYAEFGMNLILFGDTALEWSNRLSVSAIPLSSESGLHIDDRVIRQVITSLIEGLLPIPESRPDDCCLTVPGGLETLKPPVADFVSLVVKNFGYRPWLTSPSLSVVLSELSDIGMSGIGIHLGATCCQVSIVCLGREISRFDLPRGFGRHDIDSDLPAEEIPGTFLNEQAELLRELFAMTAYELQRRPERKALATPVTIALTGDIIAMPGIADLIPMCAQHASWPFAIRTLRIAADPQWAVSRGCLIQAELEQLTSANRQVA